MKTFTQRLAPLAVIMLSIAGSAMAATGTAAPAAPVAVKLHGKIGDELSSDKWRLRVLSVDRAATYESQFLAEKVTTEPSGDGEELVVVKCTITNAGTQSEMPMLSYVNPHHTALTDAQGKAYAPLAFDKEGGHTDEGLRLEPGAGTSFAALFSVPKGVVLAELTFSLQIAFEDYPDGGTDVHVTLAK
jgi:hypothetical protein